MKAPVAIVTALLVLGGLGLSAQTSPGQPNRVTLSVREADLKDILRAATEGTDTNLTFEPGMDTKVKGLELKGVTLEELLDTILPGQGLAYTREGRTLHIHRGDGGLRFYQVDHLALRRLGSKSFQVSSSGQLISAQGGGQGGGGQSGGGGQTGGSGQGGGGGQGGNSSTYTSSLQSGNSFDPWQELEVGLSTLVFGEPVDLKGGAVASSGGMSQGPPGPSSKGFAREGKSLIIQPDSGLVVVGADPGTQRRVASYLGHLQKRNQRQVLLEARIVEVTLGKDSQVGVDWGAILRAGAASGGTGTDWSSSFASGDTLNPNVGNGNGLFRLVVQNARLGAALSALARDGRLQVLSSPRISTLNNQKAILRVVREEAFFLQNSQVTPSSGLGGPIATVQITPVIVPVGIVLDIQPQIGADGMITLAVNPSVSEIATVRTFSVGGTGGASGASASLPVVDRRDLDTVVRMRSGETLVLAGIIKKKEGVDDRGVPWLQKVPFLGHLFKKQEKTHTHTELAIFITPTLVDDADQQKEVRTATEDRLKAAGANLEGERK